VIQWGPVTPTVLSTGSGAEQTQPVAPGLSTGNVSVTVSFSNGVPSVVNVAINGYSLPRIIGSISLTNKPVVQFPYVGIFAPPVS
jgi:hypothetical protein